MGVRLFWWGIGGFLGGVFFRSFVPLPWEAAALFALIAVALFGVARQRFALIAACCLLALSCGVARVELAIPARDPGLDAHIGESIVVEGTIVEEPDERERATQLVLHTDSDARVLVLAPLHAGLSYGDRVRARGELGVPERFETGPGREFDYPAFLAKDGILYTLSWADVEKLGAGEGAALKEASFFIKQYFLTGITRALPEPAAGLAGGITVGDKRGVGEELGDVFRTVGLTHVIVLSGYNITIVIYACSWLFSRFSMPRVAEFAASVVIALFFALVTGLAAASVRAAAMAVIASIGALSGRIYLASRALALVAAGMVMWNPYVLAFDPGFQLSILATTGLILLSRPIAERMGFLSERFGLREIASATIATQCAVLPLLLYQSGQLSVFALPVNLLVLAVVPTAMLFSTVAALGGLVFGALAPLIAFPALVLLSYMIAVADFFARLPFASVTIPAFGAWMLLLLYVALGGAYLVIAGQRTAAPRPSN